MFPEEIKSPIAKEFCAFEDSYKDLLQSENPLLRSIFEQVIQQKGKQLRPVFLLLIAKLCGEINTKTIFSAAIVEILHMASLIHDDVIDNTLLRRGKKSINAEFSNQIAVLAGDYLLAKVMNLCFEKLENDELINKCLANLTSELSDGELLQLYYSNKTEWCQENYFQIIKKKTAALFSTCAKIAAITANAPEETIQKLVLFGEYLGIIFQIKDDIFDYSPTINTGKPAFNDIREGKITIPLIYSLEKATDSEIEFVKNIIQEKNFQVENLQTLLSIVQQYKGIELATEKMEEYKKKALDILYSFPDSQVRQSLVLITNYVSERKK